MKYLFTAKYSDGTSLIQNQMDTSLSDSKKSAFFDVDHSKLIEFSLSDGTCVNLIDGSFRCGNTRFIILNGDGFDYDQQHDFKLIFFRKHKHRFNHLKQEESHIIRYHIGWQCKAGDKIYQRIIEIE